jgi:hypothetical protein
MYRCSFLQLLLKIQNLGMDGNGRGWRFADGHVPGILHNMLDTLGGRNLKWGIPLSSII